MTGVLRLSDLKQSLTEVVRSRGLQRLPQPVKLACGALSSDYIDGKQALSRAEDLKLAAQAALGVLEDRGIDFDAVGGLILGAAPLALGIAYSGGRSWFIVRKVPKDQGTNKLVEGTTLERGTRVLLVDDVVTTGGSIRKAYDSIQHTGATVVAAIALVDRADLAASWFEDRSIPYIPLMTYRDLGIEPVRLQHDFASA
jgi:orotate phosphoribosyltransferase